MTELRKVEETLNNYSLNCKYGDFGFYRYDKKRPNYYDQNYIQIDKITKKVISVLKKHKFHYVVAAKEVFENLEIAPEKGTLHLFSFPQKFNGEENYLDSRVEKVTNDNFLEYMNLIADYERETQMSEFGEYYNIVDQEFFQGAYYIIIKNGEIIGSFNLYNNIFENIHMKKEYRNQGIMKNYLHYVGEEGNQLVCESEVSEFYQKVGLELKGTFDEYSYTLNPERQLYLLEKVKKIFE